MNVIFKAQKSIIPLSLSAPTPTISFYATSYGVVIKRFTPEINGGKSRMQHHFIESLRGKLIRVSNLWEQDNNWND